jgi:hypothetical protein
MSISAFIENSKHLVYALEICVEMECVNAGSANNELNTNIYDSSMNFITKGYQNRKYATLNGFKQQEN